MRLMNSSATAVVIVLLAMVDIVGTPLAIVAIRQADTFAHQANQHTVQARYEDCRAAEQVRSVARLRLAKERHDLTKDLALLRVTPTPTLLREATARFAEESVQVAPVDCHAYADRAQE
jgi:hypothetical protein